MFEKSRRKDLKSRQIKDLLEKLQAAEKRESVASREAHLARKHNEIRKDVNKQYQAKVQEQRKEIHNLKTELDMYKRFVSGLGFNIPENKEVS